jgi:tyrosyl-tRNA synthetase
MGGSDQWGNITTGTEFIRRKAGGHAFALTTQLITKTDGSKFGKTETGNIWLDPHKTSPYKFYQFWLNVSDEDAKNYIRYFTLLSKEDIEALETQHNAAPHERILQKTLAKDVTVRVHSESDYKAAIEATEILFKGSIDDLKKLDEKMFLEIFDGVPHFEISENSLDNTLSLIDFLSVSTSVFPSKGEARKMLQAGGVSINKEKVTNPEGNVGSEVLINNKYILIQKGKKNYFLVKVV